MKIMKAIEICGVNELNIFLQREKIRKDNLISIQNVGSEAVFNMTYYLVVYLESDSLE